MFDLKNEPHEFVAEGREEAIQKAVEGDLSAFNDMNQVLENPYTEQHGFAHYAEPPEPEERVTQTFCGT